MGALAGLFQARYPEASKEYQEYCRIAGLHPGEILIVTEGQTLICHFATMQDPGDYSELRFIQRGLKILADWLESQAERLRIRRIAIPAIGCGVGGLDFESVHDLVVGMCDRLSALDIDVFLYKPQ